jgi:hypothetical protein
VVLGALIWQARAAGNELRRPGVQQTHRRLSAHVRILMISCIVGRSCQGRVTPKNQSLELRFRALLTEDGTQRLELGGS